MKRYVLGAALLFLAGAGGRSLAATSVNLEFNGSGSTVAATGFTGAYSLNASGFSLSGGSLNIQPAAGDMFGQYAAAEDPDAVDNVFYADLEALDRTVVDAKVTVSGFTSNFKQAGIWMGTDEDHHIRLHVVHNSNADVGGMVVEAVRENQDVRNAGFADIFPFPPSQHSRVIAPAPQTAPLTVYLRFVREFNDVTAYFSLNGTDYEYILKTGDVPDRPVTNGTTEGGFKVGLYAYGGNSGEGTAAFDYLRANSTTLPTIHLLSSNRMYDTTATLPANDWRIRLNTGGTVDLSAVNASETGFVPVRVPYRWEHSLDNPAEGADDQTAWYRLHFTVPDTFLTAAAGKRVVFKVGLNFPAEGSAKQPGQWDDPQTNRAVDEVDMTWLNGQMIGVTGAFPTLDPNDPTVNPVYRNPVDNSFSESNPITFMPGMFTARGVPREYYLPDGLLKGGGQDNVLAMKVFDQDGGSGILGTPYLEIVPGTARVTGTVKAAGTGLINARVVALNASGEATDAVMTDMNGAFTLANVPVGDTVLAVVRPGYKPMAMSLGAVGADRAVGDLTLQAETTASTFTEDFNGTGAAWQTNWDAMDKNAPPDNVRDPAVAMPGRHVSPNDLQYDSAIPGTVTIDNIINGTERGGLLSKQRFSRFASVNSARLVSAVPPLSNTSATPNAGLALDGNADSDNPSQAFFRRQYVDFVLEHHAQYGTPTGQDTQVLPQRIRWRVYAAAPYTLLAEGPIPEFLSTTPNPDTEVLKDTLTNVQPDNQGEGASEGKPVELTVARAGSYYDFYVNGQHVFGANIKVPGMTDHKLFVFGFGTLAATTWDRVTVSASNVAQPPGAQASRALRIAGGLEAAPTGAAFTALNVVNTGTSANKIDILDAVALARQSQ